MYLDLILYPLGSGISSLIAQLYPIASKIYTIWNIPTNFVTGSKGDLKSKLTSEVKHRLPVFSNEEFQFNTASVYAETAISLRRKVGNL